VPVYITVDKSKDSVQCPSCDARYYRCIGCDEFGHTTKQYIRCANCMMYRNTLEPIKTCAVMQCETCQTILSYDIRVGPKCPTCNPHLRHVNDSNCVDKTFAPAPAAATTAATPAPVFPNHASIIAAAVAAANATLPLPPLPPAYYPSHFPQFQFPPQLPILPQVSTPSSSLDAKMQRQRKAKMLRDDRKTGSLASTTTDAFAISAAMMAAAPAAADVVPPSRPNKRQKQVTTAEAAAAATAVQQQPLPPLPPPPPMFFNPQMMQCMQMMQNTGMTVNMETMDQIAKMFPMPLPPPRPSSSSGALPSSSSGASPSSGRKRKARSISQMLDDLPADDANTNTNDSPASGEKSSKKRSNKYMLFCQMKRDELIAELERRGTMRFSTDPVQRKKEVAVKFGALTKKLAQVWRCMTPAERQPYHDLYRKNELAAAAVASAAAAASSTIS
jgi:hypothetical protein